MKLLRTTFLAITLLGFASACVFGQAAKSTASQTAPAKTTDKSAAGMPSAQEIADAKAKGMVWANLNTKVYHKDGRYYGTTKNGKFLTEADAQSAGYHEAKASPIGKKATAASTVK